MKTLKKLDVVFTLSKSGQPARVTIKDIITDDSFGFKAPLVIPFEDGHGTERKGLLVAELVEIAAIYLNSLPEGWKCKESLRAEECLIEAHEALKRRIANGNIQFEGEEKPAGELSKIVEITPLYDTEIELLLRLENGTRHVIDGAAALNMEPRVGDIAVIVEVSGTPRVVQVIKSDMEG